MLPYVREPALWPVLIALLGHVVVGLSPLMLSVWRTGSVYAGLALLGLLLGSCGLVAFEIYRFRWPGPVALTCLLTWLAGGGVAWLADRTGTF